MHGEESGWPTRGLHRRCHGWMSQLLGCVWCCVRFATRESLLFFFFLFFFFSPFCYFSGWKLWIWCNYCLCVFDSWWMSVCSAIVYVWVWPGSETVRWGLRSLGRFEVFFWCSIVLWCWSYFLWLWVALDVSSDALPLFRLMAVSFWNILLLKVFLVSLKLNLRLLNIFLLNFTSSDSLDVVDFSKFHVSSDGFGNSNFTDPSS